MENKVMLDELQEEIMAMLAVCFVGEVREGTAGLELKLCNGQRFEIKLEEV